MSFFESLRPLGMDLGLRMTAAATTGPAQGPRPASSMPQTVLSPRFIAPRSNEKFGYAIVNLSAARFTAAGKVYNRANCSPF